MSNSLSAFGERTLTYFQNRFLLRSAILLRRWNIAYVRVPKAANSSIKQALYHLVTRGAVTDPAFCDYVAVPGLNQDRTWRRGLGPDVTMVSCARLAADAPDALAFTVVRNPFARVVSAYYDKVVLRDRRMRSLEAVGITRGMSFPAFVERLAEVGDDVIDIHLMSQARLLDAGGRPVPAIVGRVESLDDDWDRIRAAILARGGPQLGALGHTLVRTLDKRPPVAAFYDDVPRLADLVLARYRADFDLFYPDRAMPGSEDAAG
jgi:Sulfotransferase family.